MNFLTDSHFYIGKRHLSQGRPCQDYSWSGVLDGAAYAIASDGCSSAGQDAADDADDHLLLGRTDLGSRVVTLATAEALSAHWLTQQSTAPITSVLTSIATRQKVLSGSARQMLGLRWYDLYATNVYAFVSKCGGYTFLEGDGVVAYRLRESGQIVMSRYDWAKNMPFYPAYAQLGYKGFIEAHGGNLDAPCITSTTWTYNPNASDPCDMFVESDSHEYALGAGIEGIVHTLPDASDIDTVGVFTDGVTDFNGPDWREVVLSLLSFKSRRGPIATKRMTRYLKDCRKKGIEPQDDVGYAVILLDEEESSLSSEDS